MKRVICFKASGSQSLIEEIVCYLKEKYKVKDPDVFHPNDVDDGVHCWFKVSEEEAKEE
jgi:hypothetical protein